MVSRPPGANATRLAVALTLPAPRESTPMPTENLCPDGHLWHVQAGENPGQQSLVCLICGLVADFVSDDVAPTYQSQPGDSGSGIVSSSALLPDAEPAAHDPTLHMIKDDANTRHDLYPISTPA